MQAYVQPLCPFAVPNLWGASELNLATVSLGTVQRAPVFKMVADENMMVRCDVLLRSDVSKSTEFSHGLFN